MKRIDYLLRALLDSLKDQMALINCKGDIVYVNNAWVQFGLDNGVPANFCWKKYSYLGACERSVGNGDHDAELVYDGIRDVIAGRKSSFSFEYPCHSPTEQRWFLMTIVPLGDHLDAYFGVSHINITQRKLFELEAEARALVDPLTGLANRRMVSQFMEVEWRRNIRAQTPVSVIMLDLDFFKVINDNHGHEAGDEYLKSVSTIISTHVRRPTDLAARLGGDEFAIILGDTQVSHAIEVAEAIRRAVCDLKNEVLYYALQTTISAGVASMIPSLHSDPKIIFHIADQALYEAKRTGRNCIFEAKPSGSDETLENMTLTFAFH